MILTFISKIPDENTTENTGGMSRIISIDGYFDFAEQTYYIDFKNKKIFDKKNNTIKKLVFFELIKILKKSNTIYIHAFANMVRFLPYSVFTKAKIIFDAHGVAPEEEKSKNNYLKYIVLKSLENKILTLPDLIICVTKYMENYFKSKKISLKNTLVLPIVNKIIINDIDSKTINEIALINKQNNEKIIVYSGGIQVWQNLELMLALANKNEKKNLKFLFLSKEEEFIKKRINNDKLNHSIFVFSTNRDQISHYYDISDFGFLLREDNIVNNVAFPTKLFEYIDYEIIPIILNKNIGDFEMLGLEGILLNDFGKEIDLQNFIDKNNLIKIKLYKEFEENKIKLIDVIKGKK